MPSLLAAAGLVAPAIDFQAPFGVLPAVAPADVTRSPRVAEIYMGIEADG